MIQNLSPIDAMMLEILYAHFKNQGGSEADWEKALQKAVEASKVNPKTPAASRWGKNPPAKREWSTRFFPLDCQLENLERRSHKATAVLQTCSDQWMFYRLVKLCCGLSEEEVHLRTYFGLQCVFAEIRRLAEEHGAWRCGHPKVPGNCRSDGPRWGMRCRVCRERSNHHWERGNGRRTRASYGTTPEGIFKIRELRRLRTASGRAAEASRRYRARRKEEEQRYWSAAPVRRHVIWFRGKWYPLPERLQENW